jgi:hypothetical protein
MRLIRILAACIAAATCAPDKPVAPQPPADPATAPSGALSAAERADLAATVTDARNWLLPGRGEGTAVTDTLAERLSDLTTSLAQGSASEFVSRIRVARAELEAAAAAEPGDLVRFAVLGLVLDRVEAVIRDGLGLAAPRDAGAPDNAADRPERSLLERSLP